MDKLFRSDLPQASTSYGEREVVQGGSETNTVARAGDGGTDEKTGGGDGCGRAEDVTILVRRDKNGQDQECVHQRDSAGGKVWREKPREECDASEWTCTEERWWVYWETDAADGTARKENTAKA